MNSDTFDFEMLNKVTDEIKTISDKDREIAVLNTNNDILQREKIALIDEIKSLKDSITDLKNNHEKEVTDLKNNHEKEVDDLKEKITDFESQIEAYGDITTNASIYQCENCGDWDSYYHDDRYRLTGCKNCSSELCGNCVGDGKSCVRCECEYCGKKKKDQCINCKWEDSKYCGNRICKICDVMDLDGNGYYCFDCTKSKLSNGNDLLISGCVDDYNLVLSQSGYQDFRKIFLDEKKPKVVKKMKSHIEKVIGDDFFKEFYEKMINLIKEDISWEEFTTKIISSHPFDNSWMFGKDC